MPINICHICQLEFAEWAAYHEHLNLAHGVVHKSDGMPIKIGLGDMAALLISPQKNLGRREYSPMDPAEKRRIVAAFERRMGAAIVGLFLLLALGVPSIRAEDGHDNRESHEGRGLGEAQGSIGPQGPTGQRGPQGADGSSGINGMPGAKGAHGDNGARGQKGDKGVPGDDGNGRLALNIGAQVRWHDFQHVALMSGYKYDIRHFGQTVDILVIQIKVGMSHEERVIERQRKDIEVLQRMLATTFVVGDDK